MYLQTMGAVTSGRTRVLGQEVLSSNPIKDKADIFVQEKQITLYFVAPHSCVNSYIRSRYTINFSGIDRNTNDRE